MKRLVVITGCLAALAGCTLGPDFTPPAAALPEQWPATAAAGRVPEAWPGLFDDALLSQLMAEALAGNLNLRMATERLRQSRAASTLASAQGWPQWGVAAGYSRARGSQRGLQDISGYEGERAYSVWNAGLEVTWELDLWGRLRRQREAAAAAVEASVQDTRAVALSLQAEVARDYIRLRASQQALRVLQGNLGLAERTQALARARHAQGVASELEVAEAEALLQGLQAQLPLLELQQGQWANALALALGQPPAALQARLAGAAELPRAAQALPAGLPSELARRRPDILQAEARLHSATARVGMATADFYPRITLGGQAGLQALQLQHLGSWAARQFSAGPALQLPLFDGGRRRGELALSEAAAREAGWQYRQTVLQAWHEVDDALLACAAQQQRDQRLAAAVAASERALALAQARYREGEADLLDVQTLQQARLQRQGEQVASQAASALARVDLFRALGGGLGPALPAEPTGATSGAPGRDAGAGARPAAAAPTAARTAG